MSEKIRPIEFKEGKLILLEQRALPKDAKYVEVSTLEETIGAIRSMTVRGAPAIALAGIYGVLLYSRAQNPTQTASRDELESACSQMIASRPTAVNLRLSLEELQTSLSQDFLRGENWALISQKIELYASDFAKNDIDCNRRLSQNGLSLFREKQDLQLITHCNTGALASAGHGTALGIIRSLKESGKRIHVFVDETRPYLQGSRLTAWELETENIPYQIISDNMAAWLMKSKSIDGVIVGADRIASNGDTANKIGTYSLAIAAKYHNIPFYVAGTKSSFDMGISSGNEIPVEMRPESEVTNFSFLRDETGTPVLEEGSIAPTKARAWNPGFDVTPAALISAIITEKGVIEPVCEENIEKILS